MNERYEQILKQATDDILGVKVVNQKEFAELLIKQCAYLVNDYQRTTGYTDYAAMLCREYDIKFVPEDYYGDKE